MKLLIEITKESYKNTCNECMLPPDVEDVVQGIRNGRPIPDNATNGDMMKAMFTEVKMWGESEQTLDYSLGGMIHRVTKSWWNAQYKAESVESEG